MSKAILMRTDEQTSFLVETDDSIALPAVQVQVQHAEPLKGIPRGMQPVVDLAKVEHQFSEVKELIVTASKELLAAIAGIPQPEKVIIEFGVKLAGEAGVPMLTKASGEANFKVQIEWQKA